MQELKEGEEKMKIIYIPHWLDSMQHHSSLIHLFQQNLHSTLVRFYDNNNFLSNLSYAHLHSTLVRFYVNLPYSHKQPDRNLHSTLVRFYVFRQ